jgi:UDP-N-acetyl-D-mannosaminuronate dehydrogenase
VAEPEQRPPAPLPALTDIAIVGLGYVGLPLSLQFARSGANVLGLDIDPEKIEMINSGRSYIKHIPEQAISAERAAKRFEGMLLEEVDCWSTE